MNLPIIDIVRSKGFWRFNFQPTVIKKLDSMEECRQLLEKSRVSLTGWDFPHVPRRNWEKEGLLPAGDFLSGWCNFDVRKEYWRVYKSSQFLFLKALQEDWFAENPIYESLTKQIGDARVLGTASTIYDLTQGLVLLNRFIEAGLYQQGVRVNISLENMEGRQLWIEDRNRVAFYEPKVTGAERFAFSQQFDADDIKLNHVMIANTILRELFDYFGWQALTEQLLRDQNNLLHGKI